MVTRFRSHNAHLYVKHWLHQQCNIASAKWLYKLEKLFTIVYYCNEWKMRRSGRQFPFSLTKPTFSMPYVENCEFYKNCKLNKWFFCIRILLYFHWAEICLQRYRMGKRSHYDTCNINNIITLQTCIKYLNYLQILDNVIKYSMSSTTN